MRLWSYVIPADSGFAPNPFGGFCTLATCKPKIRKYGTVGDWVIGTGSSKHSLQGRLVYAMRVDEVVTWETYGKDSRFVNKRPTAVTRESMCGDCIFWLENGKWNWRSNEYHDQGAWAKDVGRGEKVLIGQQFYYFGKNAIEIPGRFSQVVRKTQGEQYKPNAAICSQFLEWLASKTSTGLHGIPCTWETQAVVSIGLPARKSGPAAHIEKNRKRTERCEEP